MKRVLVIVDGLNLMHALAQQKPHVEYIDLVNLSKRLINPGLEQLLGIRYFSAIASHISDRGRQKQSQFFETLRRADVDVVLGQFSHQNQVCESCGHRSKKHIEKQTDINVATALIQGAFEDLYDKVLLFSADSDLIPAVKLVKTKFPAKEIKLVSTVAYLRPVHATLGRLCDGQIRLTPELIEPHLLDFI